MKKRILMILAVILISYIFVGCHSTGSTEIGVRTRKIGIFAKKGVEDRMYAPGSTYIFLPIINDWHTFDTKLYNMEMTFDPNRGEIRDRDDLLFKTIDGNDISLDVTLAFRIDPTKGPFILQNVAKNDKELRKFIVRTIARSKPRDIFGELRTEEFYVAKKRTEKEERTKKILNDILNPYGIIVEKVLTKDYRFPPAYQAAIEERKVSDQIDEKNKSETKAKIEEYIKRVREAEGEVNKMVAKIDGEYRKAKIDADAYFEKQTLISKAILAEGTAEAEGIRKMNEALAGAGGEIMVKLEIAKRLKNKRIILLPTSSGIDLKTTNINDLLKVYGIKSVGGRK